jgi:hypothetical protein
MQVKPADEIVVKDLLVLPGSLPEGVFNADWLSTNDMWVFEVWDLCSEARCGRLVPERECWDPDIGEVICDYFANVRTDNQEGVASLSSLFLCDAILWSSAKCSGSRGWSVSTCR